MAKNNFNLTLDTLAPEGKIERPAQYLKANGSLTIDKGDAAYMKVWFDTEATGTKGTGYENASWEAAATSKITGFTTDGQYYYHLVLMDTVNNESEVYNTQLITFDTTKPVVSDFVVSDKTSNDSEYTNELIVNYSLNYSDNLSGVSKVVISCDALNSAEVLDASGNGSLSGTLTFKEGTTGLVTLTAVAIDLAGVESEPVTHSITVDLGVSAITVLLRDSEGTQLPAYINYTNIIAHLKSSDTDIVGYKVWEQGTTEPASYTNIPEEHEGEALELDVPVSLSSSDGTKTINAKVVDRAGSEASAVVSVVYDNTDPEISLTCNKTIISDKENHNTAVLTVTAADSPAGIKSYNLKVGETSIQSGNSEVPGTVEITSANSLVEGTNIITLTVIDNAGNSSIKTVNLKYDKTAPSVTAPSLNSWYKDTFGITANYSDSNTVKTIYVWSNELATSEDIPTNITAINATSSGQEISASQIKFDTIQSENNYLHIAVVDEVGNIGYAHAKFGFDSGLPSGSIKFDKLVYGTVSATTTITYEDETSKVAYMKVKGDIENPSSDWEAIAESRPVTLTDSEGMKSIEIKFKDNAGNESDWILVNAECELDTSKPSASIALFKADGETSKPAVSAEAATVVRISYTDTDSIGGMEYKLYGTFQETSTEYKTFVPVAGQSYMDIPVTADAPTSNEKVERTFSVVVRDNAGNESPVATASFYLDPTQPIVDVTNVDYNIISCVHVERRNASGPIAEKFADEVHFTLTPDEIITEWKVCAYTADTVAAGSHEDDPIGMENKSIHMSGETNSAAAIDCMIKGADFKAALGGGDVDGAHYVVVYIKNEAGLWSKSGLINA